MKDVIFASLAAILLCVSLPTMVAVRGNAMHQTAQPMQQTQSIEEKTEETKQPIQSATEPQPEPTAEEQPQVASTDFDLEFSIPVLFDDGVDSMTLHDYLVGALVGEMPLSFDIEALKAQAIACRTYALRQYGGRKHDPAAVCTASSCCECWVSASEAQEELRKKAEQAVTETAGQVLAYDGSLIEATFFSCSGGRTESAVDVWGNEIPYLIAVDSPGEEFAPRYTESKQFSLSDVRDRLCSADDTVNLGTDAQRWLGEISYTNGGGVKTVYIGGVSFSGKQLRKLFGLNSTDFQIEVSEEAVTFCTLGFGHRVGMSQYGAQAMALAGADCATILRHYYTGAELVDCRAWYPLP